MGQLANDIHQAAQAIPAVPVADPAALFTGPQLLAIFARVEAAVAALELLTRGARIVRVAGVPSDAADGEDGDLGLNTTNGDLYAKDAGRWAVLFNLKGPKGNDATGQAGASAYQLAVQQGFQGTVDQWLASLGKAGADGKSAYQLAVVGGFQGTVTQWLASLKVQGDTGQRGNVIRWESFAPTNEDGLVGDLWIHCISATKCAFYKCTASAGGQGTWSLRFTSPDPVTQTTTPSTGTGNGGTANYPVQSAATAGKYLKSSGVAGNESWDYPNRCTVELQFLQLLAATQKFFLASQLLRFEKDDNVASLSYQIGSNGAVAVPFAAGSNQYTPAAPITVPAGSLVVFTITYAGTASAAYAQVFAASTLPQL